MQDNHFGDDVAQAYDAESADMFDSVVLDPAVGLLAELAGDGRALEFAVGTGRVALPLTQAGVQVDGIELSEAMVAQMKLKPGGANVPVAIGDMTSVKVAGEFSLVYLVFNTIGNLRSQDQQVQCFVNAATHLKPGGFFVIEVGVPDLRRLPPGSNTQVFERSPDKLSFDEIDVVTQQATSYHYRFNDKGPSMFSVPFRYVWPSELDLMARIAGLEPYERWEDWNRTPFTSDSTKHVSVWRKA